MFTLNQKKYRLPENKYFQDVLSKNLIVLHFTAGSSVDGAFNSWMHQNIKIGTPYIVDRDGTVYEIFDPLCWAYHLGVTGPAANNHIHDKRSVPIEMINVGPLKLVGSDLFWWPNNYQTKYCSIADTDKFVKKSYRGFDYYATFTDAQIQTVSELVKEIAHDFSIPLTLPPTDKFDIDFYGKWNGIASHQNFRADKFDIGPAWDWNFLDRP